eukprot:TRINITY_DN22691_c0_g1_i2.p1 TRINITY_DN22691_c0_g1~~TRINITY_DN22691_c0_g1_i2.p1  ORF type:complete len:111 (+),score=50.17 TRINITY_DN22691_c0_g1_i2:129-461(+)
MFFFFFKQKTAYEMLRSLVGSEMCIRDRNKKSTRKRAHQFKLENEAKVEKKRNEIIARRLAKRAEEQERLANAMDTEGTSGPQRTNRKAKRKARAADPINKKGAMDVAKE